MENDSIYTINFSFSKSIEEQMKQIEEMTSPAFTSIQVANLEVLADQAHELGLAYCRYASATRLLLSSRAILLNSPNSDRARLQFIASFAEFAAAKHEVLEAKEKINSEEVIPRLP